MKRTTLMVDETLLDRAMKASGADTYSATVNKALEFERLAEVVPLRTISLDP